MLISKRESKFSPLNSNSGFVHILVPVVISFFILAFTWALQSQQIQKAKSMAREHRQDELRAVANALTLTLGSRYNCGANFRDKAMLNMDGSVVASLSTDELVIADPDNPTIAGHKIVAVGDKINGIKIESIKLIPYGKVEPASRAYRAGLEIVASYHENSNVVRKVLPAYLTAKFNSNLVQDCSITQLVTDTMTAEDMLCSMRGDGMDTYDPGDFNGCISRTINFSYARQEVIPTSKPGGP